MKLIIDYVLTDKPLPESAAWILTLPGASSRLGLLAWLVSSTVLLYICQRGLGILQGYIQSGVGARMVTALGADLFDHLQRLSIRTLGQQQTGDLVRRVTTDSGCARDLLIGVLLPVVSAAVSLVTMFVVMWQLSPSLSLIALFATVPLPIIMRRFTPRIAERTFQQQQLEGQIYSLAEQNLTSLPVVQAFGREEYEDGRFRRLSETTFQAYVRTLYSTIHFKMAVSMPTAIGTAGMMALGGVSVLRGSLSVGSLLVFLAYLDALYGPLSALAYLASGFASSAASSRRVFELLDTDDVIREAPGAMPLPVPASGKRGHVRLENVVFGYETRCAVLKGITLEACPGESVAIIGATGAGKSTLVSLIPRFFDPWQGRVIVDGMDVREVEVASLRRQVALVLQEPFLLPITIAENIAYGKPDAKNDDVVAAAVAANADEFIRRLPDGYNTVIGERGASLSGGEKQRISIARALLKDAPILILDEPTSSLDAKTESMLLEALERLMVGRTTFIIAHRFSTIRHADKIVVIDDGKVTESGSHGDLMTVNGTYRRYYNLQRGTARSARTEAAERVGQG